MKKIMFNDKYGLTQAVLDGRKSMTRRIVNYPSKFRGINVAGYYVCKRPSRELTEVCMYDEDERMIDEGQLLPKYKDGEVIAIAQNYEYIFKEDSRRMKEGKHLMNLPVKNVCDAPGWGNKMFVQAELMPHHIKITNINCERLQDISDEDCLKEGLIKYTKDGKVFKYDLTDKFEMFSWSNMKRTPREAFAALINKISGKGTWESNPFVWVYEFELID